MNYIDISKETEEGNWMTYEAAADALGVPYAAFRQAVAKFGGDNPSFRPRGKLGRRTMFERPQIDEMRAFMEERSFSTSNSNEISEPSLDLAQLMERLNLAKAGVWYYRRRYGKLLPSFFQRIGQSRPQARFLVREVEEFERWLAAGKPEDADLHIADVAQVPGTDLVVRYKNGISIAIINEDEARVTPEMADADAEKYIARARQELAERRTK